MKSQLRKQYLEIRDRVLSDDYLRWANGIISLNLCRLPVYRKADLIGLYASYRRETSTFDIIKNAVSNGKCVAVPKVTDTENKSMDFMRINSLSELDEGYKGIPEPSKACEKIYPADYQNILMVVPGLCFDLNGCRLGYGGGFYDRFLADLQKLRENGKNVFLMGLCYQQQVAGPGVIPMEPTDVVLDGIYTEEGLTIVNHDHYFE